MRLLTKYNTWGWILSGVQVLESAPNYWRRRGRLFCDQVRRGFLTPILTFPRQGGRDAEVRGCG